MVWTCSDQTSTVLLRLQLDLLTLLSWGQHLMGWNYHNIYSNLYLHVEIFGSWETCSCYETHLCTHSLTVKLRKHCTENLLADSTTLPPSNNQTVSFISNKCHIHAKLQKQQSCNNEHLSSKSKEEHQEKSGMNIKRTVKSRLRVYIFIVVQEDVWTLSVLHQKCGLAF